MELVSFKPDRCIVSPKTSKEESKGFPLGPVRSCFHPRRSKKSDTRESVSWALAFGENIG